MSTSFHRIFHYVEPPSGAVPLIRPGLGFGGFPGVAGPAAAGGYGTGAVCRPFAAVLGAIGQIAEVG